jgi:L-gulono-1,4-lactone dehydrogenase
MCHPPPMPIWRNWARTVQSSPQALAAPADETALQALVARAAAEGRRLRVPGSGHSWSAVAAPDDLWVQLDGLPCDARIDGDSVEVRGPLLLSALCRALEAQGRMLPNLGTITAQTVVGATATGTHGTGLLLPILSAGVVAMRLVDGQGEVQVFDQGSADLPTARVHLGALGVLTSLRLQTVPHRRLHERLESLPLEAVLERLDHWLQSHRHVRLWWLPHAGVVQVYTADLSDDPDTGPNAMAVRMDRWGLQQPVFALLLALGKLVPALVPTIHRIAQATSFPARQRVESQLHVLTMPVPPRHDEVEVSVDLADAPDALRAWWELAHRQPRAPDFVQELRFVAADDSALSPAHGRNSAYLGAYCTNPRSAAPYFRDFMALCRDLRGRPHWGKGFDHDAAELRLLYPQWSRFQELRRRCDPAGVFRGPWHDRVLGEEGG